jgi:hypothetical protein
MNYSETSMPIATPKLVVWTGNNCTIMSHALQLCPDRSRYDQRQHNLGEPTTQPKQKRERERGERWTMQQLTIWQSRESDGADVQ